MTRQDKSNPLQQAMELVAENGMEGMAQAVRIVLNEAMKIERTKALCAAPYQRTDSRRGYANGFKPKTMDTRLGRIMVDVPQTRGVEFYPAALERGLRSERALKLAIADMYIHGVSTRKVHYVMEKLCGLEVTSAAVSRATGLLDEELGRWRARPLGTIRYLILDARYEKVRIGSSVLSTAVLIAIGIKPDGRRTILGVSTSTSEGEVHWREFFLSLQRRGLHGVQFIVSDDHPGLKAAAATCFAGIPWQRCQFHLMQNAMHYVPQLQQRKAVAVDLRNVFDASDAPEAQRRLHQLVDKYAHWPKLAAWIEENLPEGFAVFQLPPAHRRSLRTTNMLERLNKEIKRRTRVVGIFPNDPALLRLVTALAVEYSDEWEAGNVYLDPEIP